jgi:alpha-beta hydrolase superfamily lysophospholipase
MEDPLVIKDPTIRLVYELFKATKSVWRFVGNITLPALILHGREDKIVPVEASQRLYSTIPSKDKNIIVYDGMKHEVLNERRKDIVYRDVLEWLRKK